MPVPEASDGEEVDDRHQEQRNDEGKDDEQPIGDALMQGVWILYSLIIQGEPPSEAVDVSPAER